MKQTTASTSVNAGAVRPSSDDRLTQRATKGDRRAFAAIYRRYHQDLYRYCAAILGNPEDAHDALQNTMVKVLHSLPGEKRQIKLKPWLYRIAHNESVELLRRRRPTDPIDAELEVAGPGAAETAEIRERLRRLMADLEELPDRQRGALVMRELSDLSFEQIGAAFGTTPAVARQTVYEARVGLQQMSEGREMSCEAVCRAISDGDRRTIRRRDIRAHLRACPGCRAFGDGVAERRHDLAALAPLPAAASAGLLHGILGGGHASSGTALAGAVGSGAGKAVATSAIVKSAATVAVVAAVGVSAADRGGLIHVGLPGSGDKAAHSSGGSGGDSGGGARGSTHLEKGAPTAGGTSTQNRGDASHGADSRGHGASNGRAGATTTPTPNQHGKGQAGHGNQGSSAANHGNGKQAAATHGEHSQSASHSHGNQAPSHPSSPPVPHPSPPPPPSNPTGNGPAVIPPPPETAPGGNSPDISRGAPFKATERPSNQEPG